MHEIGRKIDFTASTATFWKFENFKKLKKITRNFFNSITFGRIWPVEAVTRVLAVPKNAAKRHETSHSLTEKTNRDFRVVNGL